MDFNKTLKYRHSDDVQEIITSVPKWIVRWGISLLLILFIITFGLLNIIKYPDVIKARLKITSDNEAKPSVTKISGKLIRLLVHDNQFVKAQQPLGFMESTADHQSVLDLLDALKRLQSLVRANKYDGSLSEITSNSLGELQPVYQDFIQAFLNYKSMIENGYFLQNRTYLQHDISELKLQEQQLEQQKKLNVRDLSLAKDEFNMHQKLEAQKVETLAELRQQESKYLSKQAPLIQTESALITTRRSAMEKLDELNKLNSSIATEKLKFEQSLNSLISQIEVWKSKYVLTASQAGKVVFSRSLQVNQVIADDQPVFYITPARSIFFGEMQISQFNMGKVKKGQLVLIKLKSFPYEDFGVLKGRINYIAEIPVGDSLFLSNVTFKDNTTRSNKQIQLKAGMLADAEIITREATLLQRIFRVLTKSLSE